MTAASRTEFNTNVLAAKNICSKQPDFDVQLYRVGEPVESDNSYITIATGIDDVYVANDQYPITKIATPDGDLFGYVNSSGKLINFYNWGEKIRSFPIIQIGNKFYKQKPAADFDVSLDESTFDYGGDAPRWQPISFNCWYNIRGFSPYGMILVPNGKGYLTKDDTIGVESLSIIPRVKNDKNLVWTDDTTTPLSDVICEQIYKQGWYISVLNNRYFSFGYADKESTLLKLKNGQFNSNNYLVSTVYGLSNGGKLYMHADRDMTVVQSDQSIITIGANVFTPNIGRCPVSFYHYHYYGYKLNNLPFNTYFYNNSQYKYIFGNTLDDMFCISGPSYESRSFPQIGDMTDDAYVHTTLSTGVIADPTNFTSVDQVDYLPNKLKVQGQKLWPSLYQLQNNRIDRIWFVYGNYVYTVDSGYAYYSHDTTKGEPRYRIQYAKYELGKIMDYGNRAIINLYCTPGDETLYTVDDEPYVSLADVDDCASVHLISSVEITGVPFVINEVIEDNIANDKIIKPSTTAPTIPATRLRGVKIPIYDHYDSCAGIWTHSCHIFPYFEMSQHYPLIDWVHDVDIVGEVTNTSYNSICFLFGYNNQKNVCISLTSPYYINDAIFGFLLSLYNTYNCIQYNILDPTPYITSLINIVDYIKEYNFQRFTLTKIYNQEISGYEFNLKNDDTGEIKIFPMLQ